MNLHVLSNSIFIKIPTSLPLVSRCRNVGYRDVKQLAATGAEYPAGYQAVQSVLDFT